MRDFSALRPVVACRSRAVEIVFLAFSILVLFDMGSMGRGEARHVRVLAVDARVASGRRRFCPSDFWCPAEVTIFAWIPVVVGAMVFLYFLRKAQQGAERV